MFIQKTWVETYPPNFFSMRLMDGLKLENDAFTVPFQLRMIHPNQRRLPLSKVGPYDRL